MHPFIVADMWLIDAHEIAAGNMNEPSAVGKSLIYYIFIGFMGDCILYCTYEISMTMALQCLYLYTYSQLIIVSHAGHN